MPRFTAVEEGGRRKGREREEDTVRNSLEQPLSLLTSLTPPHPHPSSPLLTNIVKQLPSGDVLHDHKDVSGCGDDLVQFDDVRVTKQLENLDLPADLLCHIKTVCVWVRGVITSLVFS